MKKIYLLLLIVLFPAALSAVVYDSVGNPQSDLAQIQARLDVGAKAADATDYEESRKVINEAIQLSLKRKSDRGLMDSYYEMGRTEYLSANYPASIDNYFKSMKITLQLKDKAQEAKCLRAIGIVYYALEDFPKGIQYLNLSVSKSSDEEGNADSYTYLAGIYFNMLKYDSSEVFYKLASGIYAKKGSTANVIMCQQNMAGVYSRLGLKDKAIQAAESSVQECIKTNDKEQIAYGYFTVGFVAYENALYKKAIEGFSKAQTEYEQLHDLAYISNCHKGLSDCYYALGDSKNALEHYIHYIEIKDSTLNLEQAKEITRKEVLFQVEKKQYADSFVAFEKTNSLKILNDEKIKRQTLYAYAGIGGAVLMAILVIVLFRSNRNKQKTNELIAAQKEKVEQQKDIIEEKQKEIIDSITYAKRIQDSLLPTEKYIDHSIKRLNKN